MEGEPVYVRVLYHFDYTTKETRLISIRQGEKLELLKQTNEDWWQVRRDIDSKPFYVPAAYVREIPPPFINPLIHPPPVISKVPYHHGKNSKLIKNDFQTKISPLAEFKNIDDELDAPDNCPRKYIEAALRAELIRGNFKLKSPYENHNIIKQCNDHKIQDNKSNHPQLGNLVKDIRVQQKTVSVDNRGVTSVSFQPSVETRGYSVVHSVPKKPIPCPRVKELSKSLETLAEEIQFTPTHPNSETSSWRANGETSDYHTPSPDCLDSDMFWKKSQETPTSNVQRSSSLRMTRWPSRKKKRERKRAALHSGESESGEEDESFVDSGAEACSSSSYEWDRSGDDIGPPRPPALAFRNYTYQSTDDSDSDVEKPRPRSASDTTLPLRRFQEDHSPEDSLSGPRDDNESNKSESQNSVPKPLVALKRNQKMVGCRRRPALLCIPSNNNNNSNNNKVIKDVYLPRAPRIPPAPAPHEKPLRVLPGGWAEFYCSDAGGTGRVFYLNAVTGARSWKPPRARRPYDEGSVSSSVENTRSRSPSPADSSACLVLPSGWEEHYDEDAEQTCYIHSTTGAKWFSSSDREGRLYFFEENSNESSWTLPENIRSATPPTEKPASNAHRQTSAVAAAVAACAARQGMERRGASELASRRTIAATPAQISDDEDQSVDDATIRARLPPGALPLPNIARGSKARSMMLVDAKRGPVSEETAAKCASIPRNWPQFGEAGMTVLKEGLLQKTKLTENAKKLRKNWATSHVVLTEIFLLFFRDAKSFAAMKAGHVGNSKPELCVDLNGASVEPADKLSSRKNVFVISTSLGLQVLCQEDNMSAADSWFYGLALAIKNLEKPCGGYGTAPRIKLLPSREPSPLPDQQQHQQHLQTPDEKHIASSISRSKSVKIKKDLGSIEDLSASPTEQTKIKARLKKFFVRRPTMESLVKKGIWKDEPAFGSYLTKLCPDEGLQVPMFVQRCIAAIEGKPENMKTDGLYRASGNLSQVQKIRLQVDQNNMGVLEQEEDVHVLTGALKLFFRELKEPLIPYDAFHKALNASTNSNRKEKIQQLRDIINNLPGQNYDTLHFLLQHLLRVTEQQASNRMHIPNLAIVFGPTLMWPEQESLNMALDLMQQNIVIESLLQDFDTIFR